MLAELLREGGQGFPCISQNCSVWLPASPVPTELSNPLWVCLRPLQGPVWPYSKHDCVFPGFLSSQQWPLIWAQTCLARTLVGKCLWGTPLPSVP